jgi:quinoprotein glucose dehydrogenase
MKKEVLLIILSVLQPFDYYGGDRIGKNLFGNCLVALDARTGKTFMAFSNSAS